MEEQFTISIFVNNKPGVLVRISQTFARRGYNVESLVVSAAPDPQFSRMTVVVQGNPADFDQIQFPLVARRETKISLLPRPESACDPKVAEFEE